MSGDLYRRPVLEFLASKYSWLEAPIIGPRAGDKKKRKAPYSSAESISGDAVALMLILTGFIADVLTYLGLGEKLLKSK